MTTGTAIRGEEVELILREFDFLRKLMYECSSIIVEPGKEYLALSRLGPLAREEGFDSVQQLLSRMSREPCERLRGCVMDAMTNNETSFYRDSAPFVSLQEKVLPDLLMRNEQQKQLVIWSAASSTGQEAYSIAMLLDEKFGGLPGWRVTILATDISPTVLERAKKGIYTQNEVSRGLSEKQLHRHFRREGADWRISDHIRGRVEFRQLNLFDSWKDIPTCDIVFLRNVLIYFDVEKKQQVFAKVRSVLRPAGYMALGCAETTFGLDEHFDRIPCGQVSYYQIRNSQA